VENCLCTVIDPDANFPEKPFSTLGLVVVAFHIVRVALRVISVKIVLLY